MANYTNRAITGLRDYQGHGDPGRAGVRLQLSAGNCGGWVRAGSAGGHEDEGALGEGRVDEERDAGQSESEVDVVEEKKRGEGPEDVEDEKAGPEAEELFEEGWRAEEWGAEEEGADGDEDGGGDDERVDGESGPRQRREQVFDLSEIGERADVEAEIHELQEKEESEGDGVGRVGKVAGCSEDACVEGTRAGSG